MIPEEQFLFFVALLLPFLIYTLFQIHVSLCKYKKKVYPDNAPSVLKLSHLHNPLKTPIFVIHKNLLTVSRLLMTTFHFQ
ncbi:hypothetical protein, partial [Bacteroides heparinolyticus]|uniref:hypothetical protein n=1 Tax=Prevotella heparinolytica TaxID=28113 RepID=UPI00359F247B